MSGTSRLTGMQIRLRPREAQLLSAMASRERRRPQDQAAVLVSRALEEWFDKSVAGEAFDLPEPQPEEVEPGWIPEE